METTRARRLGRTGLGLALTAVLALSAACGGSPSAGASGAQDKDAASVYDKADSLTGQDQIDYLVDAAKKEGGTLRLYTSLSETNVPAISKAFEDKYGIKIEAYRATPEEVATKVNSEAQADFKSPADVVEARGYEMYTLAQSDLVRAIKGDFLEKIPAEDRFDKWTADRLVMITGCWNTNKMKAAEVPTTWEDLADPKYKGRFALELLDTNWFVTVYNHLVSEGMSKDDVEAYFRKVAANSSVVQGHTQMQELIASGQDDYSPDCYTYVTEGQKAKGTPTEWQPALEPVVAQPNGVGVNPNAKHPAAAALFYIWLLTDGQQVLADNGNTVPTQDFAAKSIPLDIKSYADDPTGWQGLWEDILNNKG